MKRGTLDSSEGQPEAVAAATARAAGPSTRPLARGWPAHLLAAAAFVVLALVVTWPLARDPVHRPVSWGDPVFQAWTLAWDVHAWRTDPLGVFDANIFYPYRNTLAYSDHLFGQALMVAPVLLITENPILADNVATWLALALSGLAMYALVLDLAGSRAAGLLAGIAYAVAAPRLAHLEHLHLLSAQWLPLGVLAARRALRQGSFRWAAVLGLVVVAQGLSGIYYFAFLGVLLAVVLGFGLLFERSRRALLGAAWSVLACLVALAVLLPTLLPYWQVHQELGAERTPAEVAQWSARPGDYLAVSPSHRLYGDLLGSRFHRHLEQDLFPGLLVGALALIGLTERRGGWARWALLALVGVSVAFSFGISAHALGRELPLPYRVLYEYVPGFKAIRVPARFGLLALVGLAALAGLGVARLVERLAAHRPVAALGGIALAAALLAEGMHVVAVSDPLPVTHAELQRPDYAWMQANPAPAIELPMGEGVVASAWPNYWSTFHWNPLVNGYSGITPPAYYAFRDRMRDFPSQETIALLQGIGVRTVAYHADPSRPPAEDPVLQRIAAHPQLKQVVGGPNYVFTLEPNPWLWELAAAVPDGAPVDLPALERDPATFGMLAAILQRTGHRVYGRGQLDYWRLPAAPQTVCYAVLPHDVDPAEFGYPGARGVEQRGSLVLYERAGCAGR
ncbi:hypothetical protein HRbin26_00321 [bacterium HR26]|nr:hypothetical protein HRbin26_00321 [bacterium HR26]